MKDNLAKELGKKKLEEGKTGIQVKENDFERKRKWMPVKKYRNILFVVNIFCMEKFDKSLCEKNIHEQKTKQKNLDIVTGLTQMESCKYTFKELSILTFPSMYIFVLQI